MSAGIRPQDKPVFAEAARKFQVWLLVRQTNKASWPYIGEPNYFPKPITCKAKTADSDPPPAPGQPGPGYKTAGLVVDPTLHKKVFEGAKSMKGLDLWKEFKTDYLDMKGSGYKVDLDKKSKHYGCVQYHGNYLHGDYDLYDIIVVGHEQANLTVVGTRDGAPDFRTACHFPIEEFVNERIGAEMVHHGGQAQYSEHTNDLVEIFGPKGEYSVAVAAPWVAKNFPGRLARVPGPAGGFAAMQKKS